MPADGDRMQRHRSSERAMSSAVETARPERIRRFLEDHASARFRHAEEVLPLLRRDESRVDARDARLDEPLRSIYRVGAKTTARAVPGLAEDIRELAVQLDAAKDQPLRFWYIELPSGLCYIAFELLDDRRIAGCVKSADPR